jgi:tripartite-type tricarboxylate transporter receptor subunit TctC
VKVSRRRFLHFVAGTAALPPVASFAKAQTYPTRAITLVVPFPAGGPADVMGRIIATAMQVSLHQTIIVENVTGASGSVGVGRVARARPDGYTLILGSWNTHVANGALYSLSYDVLNDFEPVSLVVNFPLLIVAKKAMPAENLKEFIAWLNANPEKATLGNPGAGSPGHIGGVFLQSMIGARFQLVPYRGAAPAMQDLVAGRIDMMIDNPVTSLPQVRAGSIKAFAVTAATRLPQAPEIPTVDEAGLPRFYLSNWGGLWVPKGAPRDIVEKLNMAAIHAMAEPAVRRQVADLGMEVPPREQQTTEALRAFHGAELAKWWPIIKAAGIKGE